MKRNWIIRFYYTDNNKQIQYTSSLTTKKITRLAAKKLATKEIKKSGGACWSFE